MKYALLDVQAIRERTTVTPQQVQRYYEDNAQQYATPEQVRASHVLLKTEGKNEADVKKLAEEIAAKAKGGADFAALAKQYSEDETNKDKGGDLDFFAKGAMVPEFDQAAFAMQPGQVSDPVKTSFGYHVIKMVEKRAATSKPLAEVQAQIEDQLKWQRAQDEAQRTADEIAGKLKTAADLDTVAKPRGFTVAESGFFARDEPIAGLGMAPAAAEQAFTLPDGEVSPVDPHAAGLRIPHGHRQAGPLRAEARRGQGRGCATTCSSRRRLKPRSRRRPPSRRSSSQAISTPPPRRPVSKPRPLT